MKLVSYSQYDRKVVHDLLSLVSFVIMKTYAMATGAYRGPAGQVREWGNEACDFESWRQTTNVVHSMATDSSSRMCSSAGGYIFQQVNNSYHLLNPNLYLIYSSTRMQYVFGFDDVK